MRLSARDRDEIITELETGDIHYDISKIIKILQQDLYLGKTTITAMGMLDTAWASK